MTQPLTLREARDARAMTQEQLAVRSGVDQTYISLIERSLRFPSQDIRQRLAEALGIAPSDLRFEPQPSATVDRSKDSRGHSVAHRALTDAADDSNAASPEGDAAHEQAKFPGFGRARRAGGR